MSVIVCDKLTEVVLAVSIQPVLDHLTDKTRRQPFFVSSRFVVSSCEKHLNVERCMTVASFAVEVVITNSVSLIY